MPRTKQTKPRHYVEDLKAISGGAQSSITTSLVNLIPSENNENGQAVNGLSEAEYKKSHLSTSPCLYDDNNKKNTFSDELDDADVETTDVASEDDQEMSKHNFKSQDLSPRRNAETPSTSSPHTVNFQETSEQQNEKESQLWKRQNIAISEPKDKDTSNRVTGQVLTGKNNGENISSKNCSQPNAGNNRHASKSSFSTDHALSHGSADTSQYYENIKKFFEKKAPKHFNSNSDAWKAWLNSSQYSGDFGFSNNSSLVNGYMKQIFDYWHAVMQDPSISNSLLYPYQYDGGVSTNRHADTMHLTSMSTSNSYSAVKQERTFSKAESSFPKELKVSPGLTKTEKENLNHRSDEESRPSENSKSWSEEEQVSRKRYPTVSPKSISSAKEATSPSSLSSLSDQRSSSEKSSNAQPFDKQTQPLANPFYPYQTWPSSAWLGYPSSTGLPNSFPFNSYPSLDALSNDSSINAKKISTSVDQGHTSNDLYSTIATSMPTSKSETNWKSLNTKKSSEPASTSSNLTGIGNNTSLEAVKRGYGLPYMPYNSFWLGSMMPFAPAMPSPYTSMNLGSKQNNSKMYFPRDFMQFPGLACSPSGPSGFYSSPLYKGDHHSSMSKMLGSRRSRSRSSGFDSVHAAIVREAKEQSKGVDPENMYIQCPICQKRIKRLYHFQRHMRIHTGEKTHQCPVCQYKSVRKDNLKSHMKTHEKQNLEGGRKNGKLLYQGSRSSANSTEKTQNHSPGVSSSHKSAEKERKPVESPTQEKYHNHTAGKPRRDKSVEDNTCSILPLSELPFRDSLIYQSSIINDVNSAGCEINKMSPKLSPDISQTYDENLKCVLSDVALKNEYVDDREKYAGFAKASFTSSRPMSEPLSDHQQQTERNAKKRDLIFHSLQYDDDEVSSKRRRISRESHQSCASSSPNAMNINNNNDRSKMDNFDGNDKPLCLTSRGNNNFAKKLDISHRKMSTPTPSRKKVFDQNNVATLAEMSLNQSLPHRLQQPENMTSSSSSLLQNSNHQREKSPANSTGSLCQLTEETSNQSQPIETTSVVNGLAKTLTTYSTAPSSFYTSCSPMSLLDPSKYHPLPLGLTLPTSHINSLSDPLPKGLFQNSSSARVKKELTSKIKSKENGSEAKVDKDKNSQDSSPKSLQCRLCSFTSLSNVELQSHVTATHKQNGFYKCEECTYLGKNLSKLVEHIRIHTGERPFKCDQCNYAAKRKDNLAQHKAVRHDKRKAKSANQYPVMSDLKRGSLLASHLAQAGKYEKSPLGLKSSMVFPPNSLSPRLSVYGRVNGGKDQELNSTNPSGSAPLTSPFHSFASVHALPTSLFQYPYYRFPSAINSPDMESEISGNVSKAVSNPASYSIKVRAALIAP